MSSFSSSSFAPTSNPQPPKTNPDSEPEQEELIPSLPYDVALNCLARVPQNHRRTLFRVSKPIRSLLSSPLFFNTRSLLHATQPVLYLHLHRRLSPSKWFALSINPLPTTPPLPLPPVPSPTYQASYAILGHDIYVIGGHLRGICSPKVWVLDCRFNRWRQGPDTRVPRVEAPAVVIDGKIYVMGGRASGPDIWAEVLDPAVGRWEEVDRHNSPFEAMDGENRIYTVDGGRLVAYDPTKIERLWSGRWNAWTCLVDGVLYSGNNHAEIIEGLEVEGERDGWRAKWKPVRGLWVLPRYLCSKAKLVGASGKLFLLWTRKRKRTYEIWCSQVEVRENNVDGELGATPSWYQKIHSSHEAFYIGGGFAVDL